MNKDHQQVSKAHAKCSNPSLRITATYCRIVAYIKIIRICPFAKTGSIPDARLEKIAKAYPKPFGVSHLRIASNIALHVE